jgi:hypothetical protein
MGKDLDKKLASLDNDTGDGFDSMREEMAGKIEKV